MKVKFGFRRLGGELGLVLIVWVQETVVIIPLLSPACPDPLSLMNRLSPVLVQHFSDRHTVCISFFKDHLFKCKSCHPKQWEPVGIKASGMNQSTILQGICFDCVGEEECSNRTSLAERQIGDGG
ncbi:hypothetical protein V6N13_130621 [Hibiscus sabdariffa]